MDDTEIERVRQKNTTQTRQRTDFYFISTFYAMHNTIYDRSATFYFQFLFLLSRIFFKLDIENFRTITSRTFTSDTQSERSTDLAFWLSFCLIILVCCKFGSGLVRYHCVLLLFIWIKSVHIKGHLPNFCVWIT